MPVQSSTNNETALPFLEHYSENGDPAQRVLCRHFPFRVGRNEKSDFVIYSSQVSNNHAVIDCRSDGFYLRDLKSTNGTFVNSQRVTETQLHSGDIIHFAQKEFRFGVAPDEAVQDCVEIDTCPVKQGEPLSLIHGREALREILHHQKVSVVFQPIVDLATGTTMGYEALGRGTHNELNPNPVQLFQLAEKCGMATQLSRLFRSVAFREVNQFAAAQCCFFNVHPSEMDEHDFVDTLGQAASEVCIGQRLVMEVHEDCVADVTAMRRLRERLDTLGIGLAYDDFGVGQSRLAELAEVPPDFLKIDMKLIRGIDQAPARQDIVAALISICARFEVCVLAEGVETVPEAECCRRLGCKWAQGFLFGRPTPSSAFLVQRRSDTRRIDLRPLLKKRNQPQA